MRKRSITFAAATALVAGVSLFGGNTQAAVVAAPNGILAAGSALNPVQNAQLYYLDGRQYCWYDDGWHGPGWYWCDYAWIINEGWGGGYGWHGWRGGHRDGRRDGRRDGHRDGAAVIRSGRVGGAATVRSGGGGGAAAVRSGGGGKGGGGGGKGGGDKGGGH